MVSLRAIRAANASLPDASPTAVFVGATSGIGLGTIEALLQLATRPRVIIIGRSQPKFSPTIFKLQDLNAKAEITFIEAQVSLLKEVDRVCTTIKSAHSSIDLLWLSQGGLADAKGARTPEGLSDDLAISFYSRMLFIERLMPLLNASNNGPRVLSMQSAGHEGTLHTSDLGLQSPNVADLGVFPTMKHRVTMMSLVMNEMAGQNPDISFIHTNPGMVSTQVHGRWIDGWTGVWAILGWFLMWTVVPLFHRLGYSPEEAGVIGFYELTEAKFAAESGTNFFRLSDKAEVLSTPTILRQYEADGWGGKIQEHILQVSERVLA